ncbi:MAG: hypothetical protein KatS3mg031_2271 [Chitinophagales bacterium]|nr:MAG: hypothetical protein KatS3mg031_2271 [Chitinophagales bacterium]
MNMPIFKSVWIAPRRMRLPRMSIFIPIMLVSLLACNKEDEVLYGLNKVPSLPAHAEKNKLKSPAQYLAILYANMFQQALSSSGLIQLTDITEAFGDKDLIHEVIISNFMNRADVHIPSDSLMRADLDAFITETYKRFFVRQPTELEKEYFRNYLQAHENVTPEIVYMAFSLSDEYRFY